MTQTRQRHARVRVRVDPDPCVVETAPLCGIVREFVEGWLKTRRSTKGQYESDERGGPVGVEPFSPYAWLAFDTGVPEGEIRKVRNPERYPLTEMRVADALLASIGDPVVFYDLTVMPSPLVPPERHGECCSGSEALRHVEQNITRGSIIKTPGPVQRPR